MPSQLGQLWRHSNSAGYGAIVRKSCTPANGCRMKQNSKRKKKKNCFSEQIDPSGPVLNFFQMVSSDILEITYALLSGQWLPIISINQKEIQSLNSILVW